MSFFDNTGHRRSNHAAGLPPPPPYNEALIQSTLSDSAHTSSQSSQNTTHDHTNLLSNSPTTLNRTINPEPAGNDIESMQQFEQDQRSSTPINQSPMTLNRSPPTSKPYSHSSSGVSYDSSTIIRQMQHTINALQAQLASQAIHQQQHYQNIPPSYPDPTSPLAATSTVPWPPIHKQISPTNVAPHLNNPYANPTIIANMNSHPTVQNHIPVQPDYSYATNPMRTNIPVPPTTHPNPVSFSHRSTNPAPVHHLAPAVGDLLDFTPIHMNGTSTIPFPSQPTHSNANNHNQNLPMQMVTQFKPLTFRQLKDNKSLQAYKIWKSLCHLEVSVHSDFCNVIHKSANGQLSITGHLTQMQSHSIYLATAKAIGESILKMIDPNQTSLGQGKELWEAIDDYYLSNSNTNLLKHETLRDDLKSIIKERNETFENYALRYSEKLAMLHHHQVNDAPTGATLAYRLIRGLNQPSIFKPVLKDINNGVDKSWYRNLQTNKNLTCIQIIKKAQEYYDMDVNFSANTSSDQRPQAQPNRPTNNNVPSNVPRNTPHRPNPPPLPAPNTRNIPPPTNATPPPALQSLLPEAEAFKTQLSNSSNILGELYAKNAEFHSSCPFHPRQSHSFISCFSLNRICREVRCSAQLREIRSVLGINTSQPQDTAGATSDHPNNVPNNNTPSPAPAPPQSAPSNNNNASNTPSRVTPTNTPNTNTSSSPHPQQQPSNTPVPQANNFARYASIDVVQEDDEVEIYDDELSMVDEIPELFFDVNAGNDDSSSDDSNNNEYNNDQSYSS